MVQFSDIVVKEPSEPVSKSIKRVSSIHTDTSSIHTDGTSQTVQQSQSLSQQELGLKLLALYGQLHGRKATTAELAEFSIKTVGFNCVDTVEINSKDHRQITDPEIVDLFMKIYGHLPTPDEKITFCDLVGIPLQDVAVLDSKECIQTRCEISKSRQHIASHDSETLHSSLTLKSTSRAVAQAVDETRQRLTPGPQGPRSLRPRPVAPLGQPSGKQSSAEPESVQEHDPQRRSRPRAGPAPRRIDTPGAAAARRLPGGGGNPAALGAPQAAPRSTGRHVNEPGSDIPHAMIARTRSLVQASPAGANVRRRPSGAEAVREPPLDSAQYGSCSGPILLSPPSGTGWADAARSEALGVGAVAAGLVSPIGSPGGSGPEFGPGSWAWGSPRDPSPTRSARSARSPGGRADTSADSDWFLADPPRHAAPALRIQTAPPRAASEPSRWGSSRGSSRSAGTLPSPSPLAGHSASASPAALVPRSESARASPSPPSSESSLAVSQAFPRQHPARAGSGATTRQAAVGESAERVLAIRPGPAAGVAPAARPSHGPEFNPSPPSFKCLSWAHDSAPPPASLTPRQSASAAAPPPSPRCTAGDSGPDTRPDIRLDTRCQAAGGLIDARLGSPADAGPPADARFGGEGLGVRDSTGPARADPPTSSPPSCPPSGSPLTVAVPLGSVSPSPSTAARPAPIACRQVSPAVPATSPTTSPNASTTSPGDALSPGGDSGTGWAAAVAWAEATLDTAGGGYALLAQRADALASPRRRALLRAGRISHLDVDSSAPGPEATAATADAVAAVAACLATHTTLEVVRLCGAGLGEPPLQPSIAPLAAALTARSGLVRLDLSRNALADGAAALLARCLAASSGGGASLLELRLWGNRVGPAGARALAEGLRRNCRLRELDVSHNPVGPAGAACIGMALHFNTALQRLNLDSCDAQDTGASFLAEALRPLCSISSQAQELCPTSSIFTSLPTSITSSSVAYLEESESPVGGGRRGCGVWWLGLADNGITDGGAAALVASLQDRAGLTRLNLSDNGVGPEIQRILEALVAGNAPELAVIKTARHEPAKACCLIALES